MTLVPPNFHIPNMLIKLLLGLILGVRLVECSQAPEAPPPSATIKDEEQLKKRASELAPKKLDACSIPLYDCWKYEPLPVSSFADSINLT